MKYQRKLHDAFGEKVVATKARRAAFDVVAEADAEVERMLVHVKALADALRKTVERARDLRDDGPDEAGWQSPELLAEIGAADAALKSAEPWIR